ncbi:MAG: cysteine desulfurase [Nanoarchaeota archaeon]
MKIQNYREDFPLLKEEIIYFDNACMTLKPMQVINKINEYYLKYPSCGNRSLHKLGKRVTEEVEKSRTTAKKFFNARKDEEIIFTRNTTEGINLISYCLKFNGNVIISDKEHNSNLVPWQKFNVIPISTKNGFNLDEFSETARKNKNSLISINHVSNLDGSENPIREIIKIAHENNCLVLIDAAQSAGHKKTDVRKLDIDFLVCSGHKMLGPTGTGILYGKKEHLEKLDNFMVGGETVLDSTYNDAKFEGLPYRFESGLQDYAGIIGLGEAITYLEKVGLDNINQHEIKLNALLTAEISNLNNISILGSKNPELRNGLFSFNIKNIEPHTISLLLDKNDIMTRSGMHCCHAWFNKNKINGSCRISLYFYNTEDEVKSAADEIKKIARLS